MRNSAKLIRLNVLALIVITAFAAVLAGCVTYVATRPAPSPQPTYAPPPLPDYEQPVCPGPGYLWVPGYWAYDANGYFWVPGMWELPPYPGWSWTPGYWSWSDGVYIWNPGYWGNQIGFYGGVNYGCGYTGAGYYGGYWKDNNFYYNSAVTNVNVAVVHNTYTQQIVVDNTTATARVSYNGGPGGITAAPTSQELIAAQEPHEPHSGPTARQRNHQMAAATNQMPNPVSVINAPAKHPFYLRALSDLRYARAHLYKLTPNEIINDQEQHAIAEIDAALREIRAAAIDDGKNLNDHQLIDVNLIKTDRYRQALDLLQKAGADINREEDNPATQGLQRRALMHVNAAEETLSALMRETHHHADHPAYLQAMSELRFARAFIEKFRPDEAANEQEQHAIAEIDAALREIRAAAIDDGKDLKEHPPIDVNLIKTDRYHKALELLVKASQDLKHEEDDKAAQGLQHRALAHIGSAVKAVHEAIAARGN